MEVDPPHALQLQQPYAILRIKRKRNEEPLDALVVDAAPSRKKTKGGLNVFQYAGTVEEAEWNDEQQKRALETRLAGLARDISSRKREDQEMSSPVAPAQGFPSHFPAVPPARSVQPAPTLPPKRTRAQLPSRTYTIVPQEENEAPHPRRHHATSPPKVWSGKELEALKRAAQFKMYEAVPSTSRGKAASVPTETDAEIEKFLPLLKDYLNVSELAPPPQEDDYVYDVFYHRPTTFQELYEPGASSNIAKLTGLPPELSGLDGEDSSDDEYSDEDDEDSNTEDWYTNDYPEEEESDRADEEDLSDEFHEQSDSEDVVHAFERDMGAYRNVMSDDF